MARFLTWLFLLLPVLAGAQFPLSADFQSLLDTFDVRVNHAFDVDFKLYEAFDNPYLREQQRLYSREEKLEMRFVLLPDDPTHVFHQMPHVQAGHLVANLASNEEDAKTTVLSLDEAEMGVLNADWARVFIFRPKRSFSDRKEAQLVASYKQGRGMAYTILLFNRAPGTLLGRQLALRWR